MSTRCATRVDGYLAAHGIELPGGTVTALLQARVLGYVFNPLTVFWCHDARGELRHVIAEVHNTYGGRHAYLLPPTGGQPAAVKKALYVSPFNDVDGYYLVRAPKPDGALDMTISLHRENKPAFVATMQGVRRKPTTLNVLRLQMRLTARPAHGCGVDPHPGRHTVGASRARRPAHSVGRTREGRSAVTINATGNVATTVDSALWPSVARVPRGPVSIATARVAESFLRRAAARLPLRLRYPDGTVVGAADPTLPTMDDPPARRAVFDVSAGRG